MSSFPVLLAMLLATASVSSAFSWTGYLGPIGSRPAGAQVTVPRRQHQCAGATGTSNTWRTKGGVHGASDISVGGGGGVRLRMSDAGVGGDSDDNNSSSGDDIEALMAASAASNTDSNTNGNTNGDSNSNSLGIDFGASNTNPTTDMGIINPEDGVGAPCVIKVLGVGGGGGNAVNRMIQTAIQGVAFWAINTDAQALAKSLAPNILNIGQSTTRGLGAGGDPKVGAQACLENYEDVKHICDGADMVFITAGMGGGTGSGAAPVVAEVAKKECGCLTVGVVTKPFAFEGRKRMKQAEDAIEALREQVDTLIVVSNDKLLRIVPDNTPVTDAFLVADDILRQGVVGISEIIVKTGLVNVDFADVRAVMKDAGTALMGVGTGVGKTRAADAAVAAISSPLLDFPIAEARRIVFNVVGGPDMGLREINSASEVIYENAHEDANIIFGALIDEAMGDEVSITVLACDFREGSTALGDPAQAKKKKAIRTVAGGFIESERSRERGGTASYDEDALWGDEGSDVEGGGDRGPLFYKERRQATRSPLGPDATIEETRVAITRGFKMPAKADDPTGGPDAEKGLRKRFRGFFRGVFGKK